MPGHLLLHMVNLQSQNRQTIDGPRGTLGIDDRIGQRLYFGVLLKEITVDAFHKIGTVLIGLIDTPFDGQSLDRVDFGIPYNIFEMPLHGVDPILMIEVILDGLFGERIYHGSIDIVLLMIVLRSIPKYMVALFAERHRSIIKFE